MAKTKKLLIQDAHAQYYKDTMLLTIPLICMSWFLNGPRVPMMCVIAFVVGNICDRLTALLRRREYVSNDYSSESFGLMIALLLPASVSWYVLIMAVTSGIIIGKEAFGGYGSYPFHPAAVGYVVAAISWPNEVFMYPQVGDKLPLLGEGTSPLVAGMSSTLKHGGLPLIPLDDLLLGSYPGSIGTTAILVIVACAIFLRARGDIKFVTPVVFLFTCAIIAFLFPRQADLTGPLFETIPERLNLVQYELFSGVVIFGAVMLISEPFTCPRNWFGKIVYAILLGITTMIFRYFGAYEAGVCFALLTMGSISNWLDRLILRLMRKRKEAAAS